MLKRRTLVWLLPLLLLLSFPFWRRPLATFLKPRIDYHPNPVQHGDMDHNFMMNNVVIMQDQAGRTTAIIRAEKARTSETPHEFILRSVDGDIFDDNNDLIKIIADTGVYNTNTKQLTLIDDVHINRVSQNQQIYTDLLYYYDKSRTIKSPGKTRLVGKNIEIKGESLDYDITTKSYLIGGRVFCSLKGLGAP